MGVGEIRESIANSKMGKLLELNTLEGKYRALACAALMATVAPTVNACTDQILTNDIQQPIEMTEDVPTDGVQEDITDDPNYNKLNSDENTTSTDSEPVNDEGNGENAQTQEGDFDSDFGDIDDLAVETGPIAPKDNINAIGGTQGTTFFVHDETAIINDFSGFIEKLKGMGIKAIDFGEYPLDKNDALILKKSGITVIAENMDSEAKNILMQWVVTN